MRFSDLENGIWQDARISILSVFLNVTEAIKPLLDNSAATKYSPESPFDKFSILHIIWGIEKYIIVWILPKSVFNSRNWCDSYYNQSPGGSDVIYFPTSLLFLKPMTIKFQCASVLSNCSYSLL